MAWPPPKLPTNRTNAMAQQDTHPADHNAANLAINDIADKVWYIDNYMLIGLTMYAFHTVGTFDTNGLWYLNWAEVGIQWKTKPVVSMMPLGYTVPSAVQGGIVLQGYLPHITPATYVCAAFENTTAAKFSGPLDVHVQVMGVRV